MPSNPNEELCQRIVADSQDAIIFADREGAIRLWDSGVEVMFGYRADETVGHTLGVVIPERLQRRHWDGWRNVKGQKKRLADLEDRLKRLGQDVA